MSNSKTKYLMLLCSAFLGTAAFASNHYVGEQVYAGSTDTIATILNTSEDGTYSVKLNSDTDTAEVVQVSEEQILSVESADQHGPGGPGQGGPGHGGPGQGGPGQGGPGHGGPGQGGPGHGGPGFPGPGPGPGYPYPGPGYPGPGYPQPYPYNTCRIFSSVNAGGVGIFNVVTRYNQTIATFFFLNQAQSFSNSDYRCRQ